MCRSCFALNQAPDRPEGRGEKGRKGGLPDRKSFENLYGRRVSSTDGKYVQSGKERVILAKNGMVFIQAWIDLQLKRETRQDIRRWLESKKTRVEKQIEGLDRHVKWEGKS